METVIKLISLINIDGFFAAKVYVEVGNIMDDYSQLNVIREKINKIEQSTDGRLDENHFVLKTNIKYESQPLGFDLLTKGHTLSYLEAEEICKDRVLSLCNRYK